MTRADFQSLLDLGCLTDVAILGLCLSPDDQDPQEMALAWPQLRDLEMILFPVDHQASRITLKGIASFLLNCKGLKKFKMMLGSPIGSPAIIAFERLDKCETCHQNIILFCDTRSQDVAMSLSEIVPNSCVAAVGYSTWYHMPTLENARRYHSPSKIVSESSGDDSQPR